MSISLREAYSAKTEIELANSAHILNIKREEKHFTLIQVFTICGIHFFHICKSFVSVEVLQRNRINDIDIY